MKKINKEKIAFTFASAEVNKIGQNFIKFMELCTGKLKLKKLHLKEEIVQLERDLEEI